MPAVKKSRPGIIMLWLRSHDLRIKFKRQLFPAFELENNLTLKFLPDFKTGCHDWEFPRQKIMKSNV